MLWMDTFWQGLDAIRCSVRILPRGEPHWRYLERWLDELRRNEDLARCQVERPHLHPEFAVWHAIEWVKAAREQSQRSHQERLGVARSRLALTDLRWYFEREWDMAFF